MTTTDPILCPFTILIDQREKAPYRFTGIHADADKAARPVVVPIRFGFLPTGDYSIDELAGEIAIERKSLEDLYSTLGQHRERFEREHERLAVLKKAAVVIECDLSYAMAFPPERSRLNPRAVYRTFLSWQWKYSVPWVWAGSRGGAEKTVYHLLRMFWKERQEERKDGSDNG